MSTDFTEGKITPQLIGFTIPLVMGNVFQLLYNAADSVIVGRFVGKEALAAVGTSNPLMTLVILFFNGVTLGAGVLIGTHYGAKDFDLLKKQISSTMIGGIVSSLLMSVIFILSARVLFMILQVDAAVLDMSVQYMRIIFCGLVFTFMYNFFAGTLRALGDSQGPLIFLMISAVINVIGDLFFVALLHMGSAGAAVSTVISEALSCVFCALYIQKRVPVLRLGKEWLVFDRAVFKETVKYGTASALQQSTVQLGKIAIQTIVNTMGVTAMAAFTIVNRIDDFAFTPQQNIGHAMTSFMAINRGAGKTERMRNGFREGMIIEICYGILISMIGYIFARQLVSLSTTDEAVIAQGVNYMHLISLMYIFPALTNGIQGYFRGVGNLKLTLYASMTNMGVRIIAALIMAQWFGLRMETLPLTYLFGWIGMLVLELPLLIRANQF